MALCVDVFFRDDRGDIKVLAYENDGDDLAGLESFRQHLYGSDQAVALGLKLLPTLRASQGVFAESKQELAQLEREAETLLGNLSLFFSYASADDAFMPARRLRNIIKAVRRARRIGGGVVIWSPLASIRGRPDLS
jgi:hypothetical protein